MSIARNDPCPCGSGKKYKKCCLGKGVAPGPSKAASAVHEVEVESRFMSPVSSYYTCCEKLIDDHPNRAMGYVSLSDGLLRAFKKAPSDPARSEEHTSELPSRGL